MNTTTELLPPNIDEYNPETGIRTTITYHLDDNNKTVRTTRRVTFLPKNARVLKGAELRRMERRKWDKFGDAVNDTNTTRYDNKLVYLFLDGKIHDDDETYAGKPAPPVPELKSEPGPESKHVEKSHRRQDDSPTIKVSNLSIYDDDHSVRQLFSLFGSIARVKVPIDRYTGKSRGFAFVSFRVKEAAERAIDKMNGYAHNSMILSVEWGKSAAQCQRERDN